VSSPDRKVLSPRGGVVYTKVNDLIDPISAHGILNFSIVSLVMLMCIGYCKYHSIGRGLKTLLLGMLLNMKGTLSDLGTIYNGVTSLVHVLLKWLFQDNRP
jgi:hypothetical protein